MRRTNVASKATATARPRPMLLLATTRPKVKATNTMNMMTAALVMILAVRPTASTTASSLLWPRRCSSCTRESKKIS